MNTYLNYLVESNLALLFFMLVYWLLLRHENQFAFKRGYLLSGILLSVLFPLIHLDPSGSIIIPAVGDMMPVHWLPEVVVDGGVAPAGQRGVLLTPWEMIFLIYWSVVAFLLIRLLVRLFQLYTFIKDSDSYVWNNCRVAESNDTRPTFSFFRFIFIGQAHTFSTEEKNEILRHEGVHVKQWHSLDILLLHVVHILFWFNPLLSIYKKIFIQLHEFEADARAVENDDVNVYCNLLAKVALQSADYKLANHFNNSLTLKRIAMIQSIKRKIKGWKIAAIASTLPVVFFIIACQDQVTAELSDIVQNSSTAMVVPEKVQARFNQLSAENPQSKYVILHLNETGLTKLEEVEKKYGLPKSVEVFKEAGDEFMKGSSESGVIIRRDETKKDTDYRYVILEFNESSQQLTDKTVVDEVFMVVEESAQPVGGLGDYYNYIKDNLKYPKEALEKNISGKVFVEFIVDTDGTIQDAHVVKGIGAGCDEEALRVIAESQAWTAARHHGKIVKQKLVLPIIFASN